MSGESRSPRRSRISTPAAYIEAELLPYCDPFTQFSIVAADEALAQAGFERKAVGGPRTAVIIGTGIGGATTIDNNAYLEYKLDGRPDTLTVPRLIPSAAPTTLGMRYGAKGPTFALASACSSAAQAIGEAFEMLRAGRADRAIAGGAEACVINGSIRSPGRRCAFSPRISAGRFRSKRNGMTLGEGAAVVHPGDAGRRAGPRRDAALRTRRLWHDERRFRSAARRCRRPVALHAACARKRRIGRPATSTISTPMARRPTPMTSPSPRRCAPSSATRRRRFRPRNPCTAMRSARAAGWSSS